MAETNTLQNIEGGHGIQAPGASAPTEANVRARRRVKWLAMLGKSKDGHASNRSSLSDAEQALKRPEKWSMGILNDKDTEEVPGSILLLSKASEFNEPLGMRQAPGRTSASSLPSPYLTPSLRNSFNRTRHSVPETKRTADGKFVLEPQPDDSLNDPLNWNVWRRDAALFSLGFYCMIGGGMTPILAAGFKEVGADFGVSQPDVALSTGLYMMGLGIGSVILSPTAILFGKRPVYLCAAICFVAACIWCAFSPDFTSLVIGRIFMGLAVSSVECLPSATVAEIFFLHEKAYRLGIYTLLLLGGKNLVPLASAAVIQSLHWRWVFKIVAIIVAFGFCLLLVFVPETFWDRTPRAHRYTQHLHRFPSSRNLFRTVSSLASPTHLRRPSRTTSTDEKAEEGQLAKTIAERRADKRHAHFQDESSTAAEVQGNLDDNGTAPVPVTSANVQGASDEKLAVEIQKDPEAVKAESEVVTDEKQPPNAAADLKTTHSNPYFDLQNVPAAALTAETPSILSPQAHPFSPNSHTQPNPPTPNPYTDFYQRQPPKTFLQQLKPWSGRLTKDKWLRVAVRPFILFAYPSILWSTLVYSLSIGWLIVLSESVAHIFENKASYHFTALQTGLVYISPFLAGVLGTAVAGKVSDRVVRYLAHRNGGIYEPEFRLVMAIPVAIFTTIGLMGYGWSAAERDRWIVPTVFFGFISFGCSLGSTTAITFAVDSYRQYAGEALVTMNFSKNIFHGLVFSLFFNKWLQADGSKKVFVAIGGIQMACMLTTIPMYIYGKRARMWTVRRNFMEKF